MIYLRSFIAGFLSTLIFHQGLLALLNVMSIAPRLAYNMNPTEPFGIPSVISAALFGGLWGMVIWKFIEKYQGRSQIIRAVILMAVSPTLVAFAVVQPLKGAEFKAIYIPFGLLLNGALGLGLWIFMQFNFSKKVTQ